mmetsp:Transcript_9413/g.27453  ORF Transcript_9413/g.27453 Transcript_9413/m.27453 type:complete len:248 (-) Transcript_9413:1165-1908(-)
MCSLLPASARSMVVTAKTRASRRRASPSEYSCSAVWRLVLMLVGSPRTMPTVATSMGSCRSARSARGEPPTCFTCMPSILSKKMAVSSDRAARRTDSSTAERNMITEPSWSTRLRARTSAAISRADLHPMMITVSGRRYAPGSAPTFCRTPRLSALARDLYLAFGASMRCVGPESRLLAKRRRLAARICDWSSAMRRRRSPRRMVYDMGGAMSTSRSLPASEVPWVCTPQSTASGKSKAMLPKVFPT